MIAFKTPALQRACEELGFTPQAFVPCVHDEARRKDLHHAIKQKFRALALECHPDRTTTPDPARDEKFKTLSAAYNELDQFLTKFRPPPPRPPRPPMGIPVVVFMDYGVQPDSTTASTTTTTGQYHFVIMR